MDCPEQLYPLLSHTSLLGILSLLLLLTLQQFVGLRSCQSRYDLWFLMATPRLLIM